MKSIVCLAGAAFLTVLSTLPSAAAELTVERINAAALGDWDHAKADKHPQAFLIRLQVLLDRVHISPGVIDGLQGENLKKAVRTYEEQNGLTPDGEIDEQLWASLEKDGAPAVQAYTISDKDMSENFAGEIPDDYAKLAEMKWIGYRGPREMLAERFHMDEDLLQALNPNADFGKPGTKIIVAAPGEKAEGRVTRIVADRSGGQLFGYGEDGKLIVAYPATIGSESNPSPSGTHKVKGVAEEPTYSYRPDVNFQQGDNTEPLEIPPGPNGPVGLVWIDLTEPTYGIHGTPEPSLIDKAGSHGCVRLTNWHALELAKLVKVGVPVEFKE